MTEDGLGAEKSLGFSSGSEAPNPGLIKANGLEHMGAIAWVARLGAARKTNGGRASHAWRLHTHKSHDASPSATNFTPRCFSTPY